MKQNLWFCLNVKKQQQFCSQRKPNTFLRGPAKYKHSPEGKGLPPAQSCALRIQLMIFKHLPWELLQVSVTASLLSLHFMEQPNTNWSKWLAPDGSSLFGKLIREDAGTNQKFVIFSLSETLKWDKRCRVSGWALWVWVLLLLCTAAPCFILSTSFIPKVFSSRQESLKKKTENQQWFHSYLEGFLFEDKQLSLTVLWWILSSTALQRP